MQLVNSNYVVTDGTLRIHLNSVKRRANIFIGREQAEMFTVQSRTNYQVVICSTIAAMLQLITPLPFASFSLRIANN